MVVLRVVVPVRRLLLWTRPDAIRETAVVMHDGPLTHRRFPMHTARVLEERLVYLAGQVELGDEQKARRKRAKKAKGVLPIRRSA